MTTAADFTLNVPAATRANTPARDSSRILIAVRGEGNAADAGSETSDVLGYVEDAARERQRRAHQAGASHRMAGFPEERSDSDASESGDQAAHRDRDSRRTSVRVRV